VGCRSFSRKLDDGELSQERPTPLVVNVYLPILASRRRRSHGDPPKPLIAQECRASPQVSSSLDGLVVLGVTLQCKELQLMPISDNRLSQCCYASGGVLRRACVLMPLLLLPLLSAQTNLPPGTIDGSVNPELIPDVVAFRLFLGALDQNGPGTAAASSLPTARQRAILLPAGLGAADVNVVIRLLASWKQTTAIAVSAAGPSSSPDLDSIAQDTMNALRSQMTAAGFGSLFTHIRSEKRNIRIVPVNMNEHSGGMK
jgi:hypothetical protein